MPVMAIPWIFGALAAACEALLAVCVGVGVGALIYETGKTIGRILTDIEVQQIESWLNTGALAQQFADAQAKAKCDSSKACPAGLPPGKGSPTPSSWSNWNAEAYRCWATKYPVGLEWYWNRPLPASWDGFWPASCTLVEAKGNYMWIFNKKGPEGLQPFLTLHELFYNQAGAQWAVVSPHYPIVKLIWRFMDKSIFVLAGPKLMGLYPGLCVEHYPGPELPFEPDNIFKLLP